MIGLSGPVNTNAHFNDIDCAAYCDRGMLRAYENGKNGLFSVPYTPSNVLAMDRTGSKLTISVSRRG